MTVEDADFLATECEIESERIKANEGMQIEEDFFEDLEMFEVSEKELSEDLLYDDMSIDEKIMLQGLKAPLDYNVVITCATAILLPLSIL